jgi:hypothetical protein
MLLLLFRPHTFGITTAAARADLRIIVGPIVATIVAKP